MKADFIISDSPNILFFKAILRKPPYVNVSISSLTSISPHLQQMKMCGYASWCCFIKYFQLLLSTATYPYPSRLKARTAFGPIQTLPSIRGVKCTPRKGNRGSGTYYKSLNIYSFTMSNAGKYFRQKLFTRKWNWYHIIMQILKQLQIRYEERLNRRLEEMAHGASWRLLMTWLRWTNKDEMGKICSMHKTEKKCIQSSGRKTWRHHLGYLGIDGRILEWI